jgi:AmiR/NasT family two-component response regulator
MTRLKFGEHLTLVAAVVGLRTFRATTAVDNARASLDSNRVIAQAIGLLMQRHALTEDAAYEVLQRRARRANAEVHELAAEMVEASERKGLALPPAADC